MTNNNSLITGISSEVGQPSEEERLHPVGLAGCADKHEADLYAHWKADVVLRITERRRQAAHLLHVQNVFPAAESKCLEVGYGKLGWLGELITWGVKETNISGIEVDEAKAAVARELLPMADLRAGDAVDLGWTEGFFQLVVVSTVFTSILDQNTKRVVAAEITRVLARGGALLWYDFASNNPRNPNVRGIGRQELKSLFPLLCGSIKSVTLAPPIARAVAPRSWCLATFLQALPFLRTHLIAVLVKR